MSRAWMPMYWGDYFVDTAHFTVAEHGAYTLLIGFYWTNGKLPADEDAIRRIAKCSNHQWKKIRPVLVEKFLPGWKHKRIDAELAKCLEKSRVNSANAKRRHSERTADDERSDTHSQSHSQKKDSKYAFESGVIRLIEKDFSQWKSSFSYLDLPAELLGLSKWAGEQGSNWYHAVSGALAKRNREAKERQTEKPKFRTMSGMDGII